jgi:murein L,D-transpeptidase YcbB/YkuD
MRAKRFDRIMAGTAIALVLAISSAANARSETQSAIEAAVPVPEPANVPPPSKDNIGGPATTPAVEAPIDIKSLTGKDLLKAPLAANLSPEDSAMAERLRDLLANRADRFISRKNERQAAEAFYRDRGFAPLWADKGAPSARAMAAIAYLRGVDADGLVPEDYPAPEFRSTDAAALADAELKFTSTLFDYARHAQLGRVHWTRVSNDIYYDRTPPDPAELLAKLASKSDLRETLDNYEPQQPGYKALKAKLADARNQTGDAAPARIGYGSALKTGKVLVEDQRVPQLRKRLGLPDGSDITYDKELEDAVAKFQKEHGLPANGQLTKATIDAMNGPRRDRDGDIIIANMERWRWMPRDLGKTYVMVNIPDFTLKIVRDGAVYWQTKIVAGKPGPTATPITSAAMKYITVNPTWNVPPSIIANEYLPAVRQDPDALKRIGLRMEQNPDGTVRIFQPPGDGNALGRIRFNFPNKFLVYQHDTPDKYLFDRWPRAYSHGCMRVQNPLKYGEMLLSIVLPKEGYTQERLHKMFGSSEINIDFPVTIPVHLTYQTAFVDDAGKLVIRDDVYGRDAELLAQLKDGARKVADIAVERSAPGSGVTKDALRYTVRSDSPFADWFQSVNDRRNDRRPGPAGRYSRQDPVGNFFERLFR